MKEIKYYWNCILIIVSIIFLEGCDPGCAGYICNESNQDIELILKFDYKTGNNYSKEQYLSWIADSFDSNLTLIDLDTTLLIGRYKIQSNKCTLLGYGIGSYPHFKFNELTVLTKNDTMQYKNLDHDRTPFKERNEGFKIGFSSTYEMIIK